MGSRHTLVDRSASSIATYSVMCQVIKLSGHVGLLDDVMFDDEISKRSQHTVGTSGVESLYWSE